MESSWVVLAGEERQGRLLEREAKDQEDSQLKNGKQTI
jgi:hypothetical protein